MKLETKIKLYYAFKFLQDAQFFGAVLVPFYTVWAGMSEQTMLFVQSWFMVSVTLLELPTGMIADRFGRRKSLMLGAVAAMVGYVLYGQFANLYLFLVCESILALAMTFFSGADEAWLVDTLIEHKASARKTEIVGKGHSMMLAGMIFGALIGGVIGSQVSLNAAMYLSAIPTFLLLVVASMMKEPKVHSANGEVFAWNQGLACLKEVLCHPVLSRLSLNLILVAVPSYFVVWLYQPLFARIGVDIVWFGVIHSAVIGFEILISSRFGWFERRLGLDTYLRLSALLTAMGFLLLVWDLNMFTLISFVMISGGFGLTRRFIAIGHFHEYVGSTYRASVVSSFSLLLRFSTTLANLFVGWLFVNSTGLTLLLLGVLPLLAVTLVPLNGVFDKKE